MNAKLLSIAYRAYNAIKRPCCDCRLPNWLGKHYFDGNCFCACHDCYPYKHGEVVIKAWRDFSIVWTRRIVNSRDQTEFTTVELRCGDTVWIGINALWNSLSLLVHCLRVKRGQRIRFHVWHGRFPYHRTLRGRARQWFDRRMDTLLLNVLDRATRAANPQLNEADRLAMEADLMFYGGE